MTKAKAFSSDEHIRRLGEGGFLGVDMSASADKISLRRLCHSENMWRDYSSGGKYLETWPGARCLWRMEGEIYGIHPSPCRDDILIHCGTGLYSADPSEPDTEPRLIYGSMNQRRSISFFSSNTLCIIDGSSYLSVRLDDNGNYIAESMINRYSPTVYADGEELEQPNALCDSFSERYTMLMPLHRQYGTAGLTYAISEDGQLCCSVTGIRWATESVHIPAYVTLGGTEYKVTEIAERAFQNDTMLTHIYIGQGITSIASSAFSGCTMLKTALIPESVEQIGDHAFFGCARLHTLTMGKGVQSIGKNAFSDCEGLSLILYSGYREDKENIGIADGNEQFLRCALNYNRYSDVAPCRLMLRPSCSAGRILSVTMDGRELPTAEYTLTKDSVFDPDKLYYTSIDNEWTVAQVTAGETVDGNYYEHQPVFYSSEYAIDKLSCAVLHVADIKDVTDKVFVLTARYYGSDKHTASDTFLKDSTLPALTEAEAIASCTSAACYDGRVFLTGCPYLPNTVFYSGYDITGRSNPAYFGIWNYMTDGIGSSPCTALCATSGGLLVYKEDREVYLHTPASSGSDRVPVIYPSVMGAVGAGCSGQALSFRDDPVFLSAKGLNAIGKEQLDAERSIYHRSTAIDPQLRQRNARDFSVTEWQGYLVLLCRGSIWLADSRELNPHGKQGYEYEWLPLTGIGGYTDDLPLYKYRDTLPYGVASMTVSGEPLCLSDRGGIPISSDTESYADCYRHVISGRADTVYADGTVGQLSCHWIEQDTDDGIKRYLLYTDGELTGGAFHPAVLAASIEDRLFMGTEAGHVLCANTDIDRSTHSCTAESAYHMCRHRYPSGIVTAADTLDIPTMAKNTVWGSCALALKPTDSSRVALSVGTDREGWRQLGIYTTGVADFGCMHMDSAALATSAPLHVMFKERTKRWSHKQYALYSNEYKQPFGICEIIYSATVAGRNKNK